MNSTPQLRALIASHGAAARHYGVDSPQARAAKLAVERQRVADERARLADHERRVRDLERQVAK